jgi:MoaE-MoaD fusion protein
MAQDVGLDRLELSVADGCTVGAAIQKLRDASPRMRWPAGSLIALNQEYVGMERVLREGDEIAIIPPVSGGGRSGEDDGAEANKHDARSYTLGCE